MLIGTAAVAAGAAAAATVIAMPSLSPAGLAGSSAKPVVTAPGAPVAPVMPATLTAATVLDQAAQAAGSQRGWPNARYWYSEAKYTCGGQLYTDKTWIYRYGKGVIEKTGPRTGGSLCTADLGTYPLFPAYDFGPYTWSQLYALPTDPAKLEPKLMADSHNTIYQHPATAAQWTSQQESFQYVVGQLTDTPAPPALREALFKVAATIHGVKVRGHYTDSLGRTGTALQLGRWTMVVDPANGLILDENPDTGPVHGHVHHRGPRHQRAEAGRVTGRPRRSKRPPATTLPAQRRRPDRSSRLQPDQRLGVRQPLRPAR